MPTGSWFELNEVRKRAISDAVWIPLHVRHTLAKEGQYGHLGYKEEFHGLGSVAFPLDKREDVKVLGWSDIGIGRNHGVWATEDYYKTVDKYQQYDKADLGTNLVLVQNFESDDPNEWHLSQDLVFALGLMRQGDEWIRPAEDYRVVVKLTRHTNGTPASIEIKNEYLRDYLCARNMFLRVAEYRNRDVIVKELAEVDEPKPQQLQNERERFELRVASIIEGGHPLGTGFAVFNMGRTDVDPEEDVPLPGPETEENTTSQSWTGKHTGQLLYRVSGELWRTAEIEPSSKSPRVRGDRVPSGVQYVVDASGSYMPSEALEDEDSPRWLWFRPDVVLHLLKHRGGTFRWYTQDTGGVSCSYGALTHFGLNSIGLVTVYAADVAKLEAWQQRLWAAYNVSPEGKVSSELLSSQMEAKPARTSAPEAVLPEILNTLNQSFEKRLKAPLFRSHPSSDDLLKNISRFRALEPGGVLALAKDLIRLVADPIDIASLQRVCPPPKGEKWGSIKSLERYLGTVTSAEDARKVIGVIVGTNKLRMADAHLPSNELDEAYALARVDRTKTPLDQGFQLIASFVSALIAAVEIMRDQP